MSRDLYFAVKTDTGWEEPIRMPETINTSMIEENPSLHGKTLYFVRYPFGKPDEARIYKSQFSEENGWQEATMALDVAAITPFVSKDKLYYSRKTENNRYDVVSIAWPSSGQSPEVQSEFDSPADEAGYTESPDGKIAVFCRRSAAGDYDIYEVRANKPRPQTAAKIEPENKPEPAVKPELKPESKPDTKPEPWKDNDSFSLTNILFNRGESDILAESMPVIDSLASYLKKSNKSVHIIGHTDATGDPEANIKLSEQRAIAVKEALVYRGIDSARVTTEGKGSSQPAVQGNAEENYKLNRRTEFQLKR